MAERADMMLRHAFSGFGISYEDALELLRNADNLTDGQRVKRDILIAAVDNLADFAVAEEYQMAEELPDLDELEDWEYGDDEYDIDEDYLNGLYAVCRKYNHNYAWVEDLDIEYAMIMANYLSQIKNETILMYMTMGDERVRPWHLQYEGFTAPKSQFPAWLIPPIEHGCRCYLVEDSASSFAKIQAASQKIPEMPDWFNRTFKESVALGGRIFSDEHPYFQISEEHVDQLSEIAERIKNKYMAK